MMRIICSAVAIFWLSTGLALAQDVREAARQAEMDQAKALQRAQEIEAQIITDREKLRAEVEGLEARQREMQAELLNLEQQIDSNEALLEELTTRWEGRELEFREISGNVRVVARDLETILMQSCMTALDPRRLLPLEPLLRQGYFPDLDDIVDLVNLFFDEMRHSGQVGFRTGSYVGRDGEEREGRILNLGKFTAAYFDGKEIGFLNYYPESQRFFALPALPPRGIQKQLRKYVEGKSDVVPIDISGGAALRQIAHRIGFREQLQAGGPIIYPLGLIALAALLIVIYKIIFLNRVHSNTVKIMGQVNTLAAEGDWEGCEDIVRQYEGKDSPVVKVISAGLASRSEDRETLESVLQESILRELPRVERGLAVLAILGAVAPLLGLLGTVTGMIDTFRVITLFGTGDPKLMSGGISEALVTTMIGLTIAIPIMLLHTFLSRRTEHIIGDMEEKAVHLTNIIHRERSRHERNSVASA